MKPGTRIETISRWPTVAPERARIVRPRAENLPLPGDGWHIVRLNAGGKVCIHESNFRVIDNR